MTDKKSENLFFSLLAASMLGIVVYGFADTFYLAAWSDSDHPNTANPVFYVHGLVFTAWMLLLVAQPLIIRSGNIGLHRRLGALGAGIAIAVVVMGILAGLEAAARPVDSALRPKTPEFLGVILFGILMFGLLAGAAFQHRHNAAAHKRLMMLATVNLLQAAIVRTPIRLPGDFGSIQTFLIADLWILPIVVWDLYSRRRIHPATLWGGLAILLSHPVRAWLSETEAWIGTAEWATNFLR